MHVHKENQKDPFSRNALWLEKEWEFLKNSLTRANLLLDSQIFSPLWISVTNAWRSLLVLPSSPNTNSHHSHAEAHTGSLWPVGLWLSWGRELVPEAAAAHSLPRGWTQTAPAKATRPQISDFPIRRSKWQGVAIIKKRSSLIAYLENSASSLVSCFSPYERII